MLSNNVVIYPVNDFTFDFLRIDDNGETSSEPISPITQQETELEVTTPGTYKNYELLVIYKVKVLINLYS